MAGPVRGKPTRRQWAFAIAMVLVPMALLVGAPALLRHWAMGQPQRDALALMEVPPAPLRGDNAFLWLATANHDVPEAELQAAIDQDNEAYSDFVRKVWAAPAPRSGKIAMYEPLQSSPYPARRRMTLGSEACSLYAQGRPCLAAVRANPAATRYLIDVEPGRMESARRALASGHVTDTYADYAPFQNWDPISLELTASALEAVEGRVPAAMQRTCRLLRWAREQSIRTTDFELRRQAWWTRGAASSLMLELRQNYPGVPLPPPCAEAVAPATAAEFDVCETARAEYRRQQRYLPNGSGKGRPAQNLALRVTTHFFSNERLGQAWLAQRHAPFCSATARDALASGTALVMPADFSPAPLACMAALQQCEALRRPLMRGSSLASRWDIVTNAQASQQLLDAAHARIDRGGHGPAPSIPGYPVRVDHQGGTWTLTLRSPSGGSAEYTLDLASPAAVSASP